MTPRAANWFVALVVDAPSIAAAIGEPPAGVRAFHPDDLHATIAFLGGVSEERARAGWAALASSQRATAITLGPVSLFGSSALSSRVPELDEAIAAARDAVWRAADARADDRPAKGHVTIARIGRRASEHDARAAERWAGALDLGSVPARVDRVALYSWDARREERLFRIVESRRL